MRLLRDGLLRLLYSGSRKQDVYLGLFTDGLVIGFSEPIGPRFVLQRAMYMPSTSVFDLPPLSDDWRHCFVLTNVERAYLLIARSAAEKQEWLTAIRNALSIAKQAASEEYAQTALLDEAFLSLQTPTRYTFPGPAGERFLLLDDLSVHDLLYEIYDQRTNASAQTYLCSQLRRRLKTHAHDVIFYLPQLCNFVVAFTTCVTSEVQAFILHGASESRHFALMAYLFLQANPPLDALSNRHFVLLQSILSHASNVRKRSDSVSAPKADPNTMTVTELVDELHAAGITSVGIGGEGGGKEAGLADMVRASRRRKNAVGAMENNSNSNHASVAAVQKTAYQLFQAEIDFLAMLNKIGDSLQAVEPEKRKETLKHELTMLGNLFPSHLYLPFFPDSNIKAIPPDEIHVFQTRCRAPYLIHVIFTQDDRAHDHSQLQCTLLATSLGSSGGSVPSSPSPSSRSSNSGGNAAEGDEKEAPVPGLTERSAMAAIEAPAMARAAEPEQLSPDSMNLQAALAGKSVSQFDELPREGFTTIFGESWTEKVKRIRAASSWGELPDWHLTSVIVKTGDCLTQEQFAMQLISAMNDIFLGAGLPLKLRTYRIVATDPSSGLIETVPDAVSIHGLKKSLLSRGLRTHLSFHFKNMYHTPALAKTALSNFIESLAAYSVASYVLQIKDRHNGNILLDSKGHVIHIDFGFILGQSPGNMNFETAPFKLTQEMVDLMGGRPSNGWAYYCALCVKGFRVLRAEARRLECLIRMLVPGVGQRLPCFQPSGANVVDAMMKRLHLDLGNKQLVECVMDLIEQSYQNYRTGQYDVYQKLTNGLLY